MRAYPYLLVDCVVRSFTALLAFASAPIRGSGPQMIAHFSQFIYRLIFKYPVQTSLILNKKLG